MVSRRQALDGTSPPRPPRHTPPRDATNHPHHCAHPHDEQQQPSTRAGALRILVWIASAPCYAVAELEEYETHPVGRHTLLKAPGTASSPALFRLNLGTSRNATGAPGVESPPVDVERPPQGPALAAPALQGSRVSQGRPLLPLALFSAWRAALWAGAVLRPPARTPTRPTVARWFAPPAAARNPRALFSASSCPGLKTATTARVVGTQCFFF